MGEAMSDLKELGQAHREWDAWQVVVKELTDLGINVNAQPRLVAAMTWWGEELACLRALQDPVVSHNAWRGRYIDAVRNQMVD